MAARGRRVGTHGARRSVSSSRTNCASTSFTLSSTRRIAPFHTVKVYASDDASRPQQAKQCITKVIPERFEERNGTPLTHAKIQIETGRQHQIRAQSAFHGFPLWGDTAYGGNKTDQYGGQFYLVAKEIEFPANELDIPLVLQVK